MAPSKLDSVELSVKWYKNWYSIGDRCPLMPNNNKKSVPQIIFKVGHDRKRQIYRLGYIELKISVIILSPSTATQMDLLVEFNLSETCLKSLGFIWVNLKIWNLFIFKMEQVHSTYSIMCSIMI